MLGSSTAAQPQQGLLAWGCALTVSKPLTFRYLTGQRSLGVKLCFRCETPKQNELIPLRLERAAVSEVRSSLCWYVFAELIVETQGVEEFFPLSMYIPPCRLL